MKKEMKIYNILEIEVLVSGEINVHTETFETEELQENWMQAKAKELVSDGQLYIINQSGHHIFTDSEGNTTRYALEVTELQLSSPDEQTLSSAKIETPFGTVFVQHFDDPNYPSISIILRTEDDYEEDIVMVGYDKEDNRLASYLWENGEEDYSRKVTIRR